MRNGGILLCLLLIASLAHADAWLVDPVVQKGKPQTTFDLGKIEPGQGLEVIFSKESGYGNGAYWTSYTWNGSTNETVRLVNSSVGEESLIGSLQSTGFTQEGTYEATLTLRGNPELLQDETYTLVYTVQKNLVKGSLAAQDVQGKVNQTIPFTVLLVNDSSTEIRMRVQPELPSTWSKTIELTLKPRSFETITVDVIPRFAGEKRFPIHLVNAETNQIYSTLQGNLTAQPELKDRYAAGLYGFPFFTISLVANSLANAFFSLLL